MFKAFGSYGARAWFVHLTAVAGLSFAMPAQAADKLVVAFGDSLSAGYGLPANQGFAPRLERALRGSGVAARVHNAGVSGDTTTGGRARLNWVLTSLKAKPDLVILELGANDMLRGTNPAVTRANMDAMLGELSKRRIRVLVAGMLAAPNAGQTYGRAFNSIYPELAAKYKAPLYPFFLRGVAGNRAMVLPDGVHPNAAGVETVVKGILPRVVAALK